ncbi:MAG: hypothetical protein IEMM0002_1151 [bacterium]|nr:MAG: hypothetical protein IEMM0002_1151 [bacterium]
MNKTRRKQEENLTFSRSQVYLILGCIAAIAVLAFTIGRISGAKGDRKEASRMSSRAASEAEVLKEITGFEERLKDVLKKTGRVVEKPGVEKKSENRTGADANKVELSFAERLSEDLRAEPLNESELEIRVKTLEEIPRKAAVPTEKEVDVKANKRPWDFFAEPAAKDTGRLVKNVVREPLMPPTAVLPTPGQFNSIPEKPVEPVEKPKRSDVLKKPRYTIQVASLPSEDDAMTLHLKLKRKGYDSYIRKLVRSKAVWYRVRIGAYEKLWEAEKYLDKLNNLERLEGIIMKYE